MALSRSDENVREDVIHLSHFEMISILDFDAFFSVIITHTVGQMTEKQHGTEIGTQTVLPATSLNFSLLCQMNGAAAENSDLIFDAQMKRNEMILQKQIEALRHFDVEMNGIEPPNTADEQFDSIELGRLEPVIYDIFFDRLRPHMNHAPGKVQLIRLKNNFSEITTWMAIR